MFGNLTTVALYNNKIYEGLILSLLQKNKIKIIHLEKITLNSITLMLNYLTQKQLEEITFIELQTEGGEEEGNIFIQEFGENLNKVKIINTTCLTLDIRAFINNIKPEFIDTAKLTPDESQLAEQKEETLSFSQGQNTKIYMILYLRFNYSFIFFILLYYNMISNSYKKYRITNTRKIRSKCRFRTKKIWKNNFKGGAAADAAVVDDKLLKDFLIKTLNFFPREDDAEIKFKRIKNDNKVLDRFELPNFSPDGTTGFGNVSKLSEQSENQLIDNSYIYNKFQFSFRYIFCGSTILYHMMSPMGLYNHALIKKLFKKFPK